MGLSTDLSHADRMGIEDQTQSPLGSMLQPGKKVRNARNSFRAIPLSISCVMMCFAFMMLPSALAASASD